MFQVKYAKYPSRFHRVIEDIEDMWISGPWDWLHHATRVTPPHLGTPSQEKDGQGMSTWQIWSQLVQCTSACGCGYLMLPTAELLGGIMRHPRTTKIRAAYAGALPTRPHFELTRRNSLCWCFCGLTHAYAHRALLTRGPYCPFLTKNEQLGLEPLDFVRLFGNLNALPMRHYAGLSVTLYQRRCASSAGKSAGWGRGLNGTSSSEMPAEAVGSSDCSSDDACSMLRQGVWISSGIRVSQNFPVERHPTSWKDFHVRNLITWHLMSWQYHQRWWIAHRFDQWNLQALQCTISEFYVFRDCNIKITSPNFTQESEFGWNWYDSIPSSLNTSWTSPGYIHFKGVWVSRIWVTFGNAIPLNEQVYGHNLISHDSWHVIIIGVTCQTHPNCWLLSPWLSISIKLTPHNVPLAVPGSSGGGPGAQSRNHLLHVEVWRSIDAPHVGGKTWETQLEMPLKGRPFHHVWDLLDILSPPPSPAVVQECQGLQLFIFIPGRCIDNKICQTHSPRNLSERDLWARSLFPWPSLCTRSLLEISWQDLRTSSP